MRTLAIDIGGTGLKAMILGPDGAALTERLRVDTPRPATPQALLDAVWGLVGPIGEYDRVSVGFPGVVVEGVIHTAPNLDDGWSGYELGKTIGDQLKRPVRVLNDAGIQGYGAIEGKGTEMVLTFGTGMGCALYVDGKYVPNLELAHHPFRKGMSYEDYVDDKALEAIGKKKWNRRVKRVIDTILPVFNPRVLYLGGGNSKNIKLDLPPYVKIIDNVAGLLGGIALWKHN